MADKPITAAQLDNWRKEIEGKIKTRTDLQTEIDGLKESLTDGLQEFADLCEIETPPTGKRVAKSSGTTGPKLSKDERDKWLKATIGKKTMKEDTIREKFGVDHPGLRLRMTSHTDMLKKSREDGKDCWSVK